MSRSLDTKSTSIAVPDRGSFATGHQQCYLSPPLTPYPHFHSSHDSLDSISPVLAPYHTPLPSLQEMLPHDGRQRRSARDLGRYNSPSASRHHPRRESKEILESSTSAIYTGGQVANDPARLLPMYPTENHVTIPPPATIVSPMLRRNKAHVASACVNCKKAHLACEGIYSSPITSDSPARSINSRYRFCCLLFPPFSCLPPIVCRSPIWRNVDACQPCGSAARIFGLFSIYVFVLFHFFFGIYPFFLSPDAGCGSGIGKGGFLDCIASSPFWLGHAYKNVVRRADRDSN